MNKMRTLLVAGALLTGTLLYGCGSEPTATPVPAATDTVAAPTATVAAPTATTAVAESTATTATSSGLPSGSKLTGPAADLLNQSTEAMKNIKSFHFTLATAASAGGTASEVQGEGDFILPDKARLTLKVPGVEGGSVETIIIGSDTYMKQPGSESYIDLGGVGSPLAGVNGLNRPQELAGFASLADSADIKGDEQVDGADTTKIEFSYDMSKAMDAASQAAGTAATPDPALQGKKATGQMWIDKSTHYVRKLVITSPSGDLGTGTATGDTTVTLTYSKFDETIDPPIEKPTNVTTLPSQLPPGLGTMEPFGTPAP